MTDRRVPGEGGSEDVEAPVGAEEARGWIGAKLDEMGGSAAGRVTGLLVDAIDGSPSWLVARLGRFGKHAAVPVEFVAGSAGRVWVPFPHETIRAASPIDPAGALSSGEERALAAIYEIPEHSGRLEVIAGRADDEPGSVPTG